MPACIVRLCGTHPVSELTLGARTDDIGPRRSGCSVRNGAGRNCFGVHLMNVLVFALGYAPLPHEWVIRIKAANTSALRTRESPNGSACT